MIETKLAPYSSVIVKLLNGEIYESDRHWQDLMEYRVPINEYLQRIGLEVIVDQRDGFAFIRQQELDDEGKTVGLVKRTALSYEVTLLLVLLREMIENHELKEAAAPACFVSHSQIRDELELYFKDTPNKVKLLRQLDRYIKQILDLGFLKIVHDSPVPNDRQYELKRIIKAKITADVLEDIRRKMECVATRG